PRAPAPVFALVLALALALVLARESAEVPEDARLERADVVDAVSVVLLAMRVGPHVRSRALLQEVQRSRRHRERGLRVAGAVVAARVRLSVGAAGVHLAAGARRDGDRAGGR